ncbi:hypothetical protein QKG27_gp114 [Gallid alphaherpesvirus 3]|uniref:Uncharacterized protein ORF473 n=1 Tax=Gallid alphaherpesvirus 3 TaxID=35250 RepID=F8TC89_9ALPH|nr:hypothetical protein QKG27_gp114 [Gallid alphaherpesvirus 3]AEI00300.1 hypothetical protein [Gallid alphaherpesvirus 3]QEY02304.1 hypothetical protein [Gallid alphaherpesvirus 3]
MDASPITVSSFPLWRVSHCFTFSSWGRGVRAGNMPMSSVVPFTKKLNGLQSRSSIGPLSEKLHVPSIVRSMSLDIGSPLIMIKRVYSPPNSGAGAANTNVNSSRSIYAVFA